MIAEQRPYGSTAEQVASILRDKIVCGAIRPGTALRQEQVAQQFGSSHVPVREAFQRLEALGLVVNLPRRGVRVAPLDTAAIRETVEMRSALECLALRHAAPNMSAHHMAGLESAQRQCNEAGSLDEWDAANRAFHRALVAACQMPRLIGMLETVQLAHSRFVFAAGRASGWRPRSNHDHQLIIDALKAKDAERALMLLGRHIGTMERVGFPAIDTVQEDAHPVERSR